MDQQRVKSELLLPPLPLEEWKETKDTIHLFLQITGKIRLKLCSPLNHWWHAALYVTTCGISTRLIPYSYGTFEIEFDFIQHQLIIRTSLNESRSFSLYDGLSVSGFYEKIFKCLAELGINVKIRAVPYGIQITEPFATDTVHASYNKEKVESFHKMLIYINSVMEEFRGWFNGKSTPVHLFWHSFDLALTRFSGKTVSAPEGMGKVDREAYSHEVISFGFWAGDENIPAPAFYSYTYPQPEKLTAEKLKPESAYWGELRGGAIALLMYDEVRKSGSPKKAILDFLQSTYEAGAKAAGWDIEKFKSSVLK